MPSVSDILAQHAKLREHTPVRNLPLERKAEQVAEAAARKKKELGGDYPTLINPNPNQSTYLDGVVGREQGTGSSIETEAASDVRNMNPIELYMKYGPKARELIAGSAQANADYYSDASVGRTTDEVITDALIGFPASAARTYLGLSTALAGVFDDDAGVLGAEIGQDFTNWVHGKQSAGLNMQRKVVASQNDLAQRDRARQQEEDRKMYGGFAAGAKRIGGDAYDAIGNALDNGTVAADGVVDGAGSLLIGGPMAKGLGLVAGKPLRALAGKAIETGLVSAGSRVAGKAYDVVAKSGMPLTIGAMEAGGVYSDTAMKIMDMNHAQLMVGSEEYRNLLRQGYSEDEAKRQIAGAAAGEAAAWQFPMAMAAGRLVSKFEANPLARGTLRELGKNAVRETIEEGAQSFTGSINSNAAIRNNADSTIDMLEGVGEQTGLGALYGFGTAAAIGGPGTIGTKANQGIKAVGGAVAARGRRLEAEAEEQAAAQTNTAAAEQIQVAMKLFDDLNNSAETDPETAAQAIDYLSSAIGFDPSTLPPETHGTIKQTLEDVSDSFSAIEALNELIEQTQPGSVIHSQAARLVDQIYNKNNDILEFGPDTLDLFPDGPARTALDQASKAMVAIRDSAIGQKAGKAAEDTVVMQASTIDSFEEPGSVDTVVRAAEARPASVTPEQVDVLLQNYEDGSVSLSPAQIAALKVSSALVQAQRNVVEQKLVSGEATSRDLVSADIFGKGVSEDGYKSLSKHAKDIVAAYRNNDFDTARDRLQNLLNFAQHMQNKLGSVNAHHAKGTGNVEDRVPFEAWNGKSWSMEPGSWANPEAGKTVEFAQSLSQEAAVTAEVANSMVDIFPELGLQKIQPESLTPDLQGSPNEVKRRAKMAKAKAQAGGTPAAKPVANSPSKATDAKAQNENKTAPAKPRFTADQVRNVSDSNLQKAIDRYFDKREAGTVTPEDQATFEVLDAEMTRREDEAANQERIAAETEIQKQQEAEDIRRAEEAQRAVDNVPEPTETVTDEQGTEAEVEAVVEEAPAEVEEPAAEPTSDPVVSPEVVSADPEPETKVKTLLGQMFRNLIGNRVGSPLTNRFLQAFKLPEKTVSNLVGIEETPLDHVMDVIQDPRRFANVTGEPEGALTADLVNAWEGELSQVPKIVARLNQRLQKKLKGQTPEQIDKLMGYKNGRTINLADGTSSKNPTYNQALVEAAALAATQWLQIANNFKGQRKAKNILGILGISESSKSDAAFQVKGEMSTLSTEFSKGLTSTEAARSLANMIRRYWGVQGNSDAGKGHIEGIPEGMAKELISVLIEMKFITTATPIENLFGRNSGIKNPTIFRVTPVEKENAINDMPDLIERIVAAKPERKNYVGSPPTEVPETQHNNNKTKLTVMQRAAVRNRQNNKFTLNTPMLAFYEALGESGVTRYLGGGAITEDTPLNKRDRKAIEGRNLTVKIAFNDINTLLKEMRAKSKLTGDVLSEIPVYFKYTFNRFNRMQMLGPSNPQANKLMREVLLPTWATVNMTSNEDTSGYRGFMLAMAQHLGVKVELLQPDIAIAKVSEKLVSEYAGSIDGLKEWLATDQKAIPGDLLVTLESELGKITPSKLHALMEYARLQNADAAGKANFRTALYLEADGKTNGPINALNIFTPGAYTVKWLENVLRGGLAFGPGATPLAETLAKVKGKDLYETSADDFQSRLMAFRELLKPTVFADQANHLDTLMSLILGDVVKDGDNLVFSRGITKNPLTVTIYGAGAAGIASSITDNLLKELSAGFSAALQRQADQPGLSLAEAMFPGDEGAEQKFTDLSKAINALTTSSVGKFKGKRQWNKTTVSPIEIDPKTFEVKDERLKHLESNMNVLFVETMQESISETLGSELTGAARMVQTAVQVQGLVLEHLFKKAVETRLAQKAAYSKDFNKQDYLTQKELDEIWASLAKYAPIMTSEEQNYYLAGREVSDLGTDTFSTNLEDKLQTPAFLEGPADPGVSGIPGMNIGNGDGMMMLAYALQQGGADGTLDVFDGLNMPIDKIEEFSRRANEAVLTSWQRNPMRMLADSLNEFVNELDTRTLSKEVIEKLEKSLVPAEERGMHRTPAAIKKQLQKLAKDVEDSARYLEAKKRAMSQVTFSVDQMASGTAPYVHEGSISLEGKNPDEIAEILNDLTQKELAKINKDLDEVEAVGVNPIVAELGVQLPSGAYVVDNANLNDLGKRLGANKWQQRLIQSMLVPLKARGYRVVVGSKSQLASFLIANEAPSNVYDNLINAPGKTSGVTVPGMGLILLESSTPEVLLHEMIHGATFDVVYRYYAGLDLGKDAGTIRLAVKNTEALMNQFLDMDMTGQSMEVLKTYSNTVRVIQNALAEGNQAKALNEFMAWGLSNVALAETLEKTKASPLAVMVRKVIDAIKMMVFGNAARSPVLDDMFTNLRFNTEVMAELGRHEATDLYSDTVLFHSSVYGTDDYVTRMDRILNERVIVFLRNKNAKSGPLQDARVTAQFKELASKSRRITAAVDAGFNFTMQQKTTFQSIHVAMASMTQLDGNALTRAAELFDHANRTLEVDDFLLNDGRDPQADFHQASEKYNLLFNSFGAERDAQGRSSLLPTFLALALISDQVRDVLKTLPMPQTAKNKAGTFDAKVENMAIDAMTSLGKIVSGEGRNQPHVAAAIAALTDQIMETAEERKGFYDRYVSPIGNAFDGMNQKTIDIAQQASEYVFKKAGKIQKSTNIPAVRVGAEAARITAAMFNTDIAGTVAESWVSIMNKSNLPEIAQKLVTDMIGRTQSNSGIYDLIKRVRTMVQQRRQEYREHLPETLKGKFSRKLTEAENRSMFQGLGKTDITSLLGQGMSITQVVQMLANPGNVSTEIQSTEQAIQSLDPAAAQLILQKSRQLANWMSTGQAGVNLLRNAAAVTDLVGEVAPRGYTANPGMYDLVDKLTTLYALDALSTEAKDSLAKLAQNEVDGLSFSLSLLSGLRKTEMAKSNGKMDHYNSYKGFFPSEQTKGGTLMVRADSKKAELLKQGFVRIGDYNGSTIERNSVSRGYYYLPVSTRSTYAQGLVQMVQHTVNGVDRWSGLTHGRTVAGEVHSKATVAQAFRNRFRETGTEPLLPIYDETKQIAGYERSVDPMMLSMIPHSEDFFHSMGMWAGRQIEERESSQVNALVLQNLRSMWQTDIAKSSKKQDEYVDLFDSKVLAANPVLKDTMENMPGETLQQIRSVFGDQFFVRKDLLDDAIGYRKAGVRDLWSGISNWSPDNQKRAREIMVGVFGKKAYQRLVQAEQLTQNLVTDAKVLIVVKSMVVPMVNLLANVYQLAGRGVPMNRIAVGFPKKAAEINEYLRTKSKEMELKAEFRAATTKFEKDRLRSEIQSIQDRHRRMSIWPLIEAGEFTSISDATLTEEDMTLSGGRLSDFLDRQVEKLPAGLQTAAKYGMVSRDTALFKGMQRAVQYGDFVAKAVLYDDLTNRLAKTPTEALAAISDEFVNYDRLPGRSRGYLEDVGLIWFWHFKIRSVKVALSMIRNNPLHVLLSGVIPRPDLFGSIGTPIEDNFLSTLVDGRLDNSVGYDMLFRAPGMNPVFNVTT